MSAMEATKNPSLQRCVSAIHVKHPRNWSKQPEFSSNISSYRSGNEGIPNLCTFVFKVNDTNWNRIAFAGIVAMILRCKNPSGVQSSTDSFPQWFFESRTICSAEDFGHLSPQSLIKMIVK